MLRRWRTCARGEVSPPSITFKLFELFLDQNELTKTELEDVMGVPFPVSWPHVSD